MSNRLSITRAGLSVSAVLAVPYVFLMLASLLLVGLGTTRSWKAFSLGIGVSTIAGLEIGILGVGIVGFAVALLLAPVYNALLRPVGDGSGNRVRAGPSSRLSARSWQVRVLAACLVLPALALMAMRILVSEAALGASSRAVEPAAQNPGSPVGPLAIGPVINTAYRESEPSFAADGRTMYFNCYNGDICVSDMIGAWHDRSWTPPQRLKAPISTEYEEIEPVINAAGDKLYFTSRRPDSRLWGVPFLSPFLDVFRVVNTLASARLGRTFFGGLGFTDVYVSYWIDGAWSEPKKLNQIAGEPPVNTEFMDHCLFFSADGKEAFWTSTRPGGFGDNDIWTSQLVGGKWTEPRNLGPNVNGAGSEHTSIPSPDGQLLFVTATLPGGFGEEDIYVTTRGSDGAWSPLVNLGPGVNGPGDDRCPAWTPDLEIFMFDSVRKGGFGSRDIWWVHYKDVITKR